MNKQEILKKFKDVNTIKKTILNYKTNEQIKNDFIKHIKESFTNKLTGEPINEKEINENLKEDENTINFYNLFIWKNKTKQTTTINKLTLDIKTTSIKEYDKINGLWFKTDFAKYELIKEDK